MATEVIEKLGEHGLLEVYKSIKASVREDCGEYFRDLPGNNELEPANADTRLQNVLRKPLLEKAIRPFSVDQLNDAFTLVPGPVDDVYGFLKTIEPPPRPKLKLVVSSNDLLNENIKKPTLTVSMKASEQPKRKREKDSDDEEYTPEVDSTAKTKRGKGKSTRRKR